MRVLMCAYACSPAAGSEPGIGWNWAEQASRHHEVWVVTHSEFQPDIEKELAKNPNPNLHFVYHSLPAWTGNNQRLPSYVAWHLTAIKIGRRLHREHHFDVAHHVTYGAFRFPTFLAWLDIPFAIGPISGAERAPLSFYRSFGLKSAMTEAIRNISSAMVWAIPLTRRTFKKATTILVITEATRKLLPKWAQSKARIEIAIVHRPEAGPHPDNYDNLKVLMIGRMIYWKGLPYGIRAFAEFKKRFPAARLSICGDGPEWKKLENLCAELGITDSVDFLYNYTHQQTIDLYPEHSVYLSPIVHYNGIAVLEAMDAGVPVVELETGDKQGAVQDDTGIRVPRLNPDQAVRDLAAALTRLAEDPALARKLGEAGHHRVCERFDPKQRVNVIDSVYEDLRAANRGS